MTLAAVARTVLSGEDPPADLAASYWADVDGGARPREEIIAVMAVLGAHPPRTGAATGFARYIAQTYPQTELPASRDAVNIVGSGGGPSTFNISTAATFVAAAAGARVLKSGSAAYSSRVGSQDVLSSLGLAAPLSDERLDAMLGEVGLGFTPPRRYAPICRRLAVALSPLPFKTAGRFVNALGPLIGPHRVKASVVGASSPELFRLFREIGADLGRAMLIVASEFGIDELVSAGANRCAWTTTGAEWRDQGRPAEAPPRDLGGGDLAENRAALIAVLNGAAPQDALDTVARNAGAALLAADLASDLDDGSARALDAIAKGAAAAKLAEAQDFLAAERERSAA